METVRQSSLIGADGPLNVLWVAYWRAEEEAEAKKGDNTLLQESSNVKNDHILLPHSIFADENLLETDSLSSKEENNWEDNNESGKKSCLFAWMDSSNISYAKEKLIQILVGEVLISKQR